MENRIRQILQEIKREILTYTGTHLLEDEIIDSFDVMDIVAAIEDEFEVEIDPELIIAENFSTVESIVEMVRVSIIED